MGIQRTIKLFLGVLMMLVPSSAWAEQHVIWKIGESVNPIYEIASPLYRSSVIHLGGRYGRGKTSSSKRITRLPQHRGQPGK